MVVCVFGFEVVLKLVDVVDVLVLVICYGWCVLMVMFVWIVF